MGEQGCFAAFAVIPREPRDPHDDVESHYAGDGTVCGIGREVCD